MKVNLPVTANELLLAVDDSIVTRTDEFKDQGKQELFGAVSLSMKL